MSKRLYSLAKANRDGRNAYYKFLKKIKKNRFKWARFSNTRDISSINSTCNSNCRCLESEYHPICSRDGKTNYFSPCHAGCKKTQKKPKDPIDTDKDVLDLYWDCSCISDDIIDMDDPYWYELSDLTLSNPLIDRLQDAKQTEIMKIFCRMK